MLSDDLARAKFDPDTGEARAMTLEYVGPVSTRFISDQTFVSAIMGPYGSAKTTSCFQKILNAACWQFPMADGIRRIVVCCIRATYTQLQTNVMEDWFRWFPKTKANWNGEQMKHVFQIDILGFGRIEITMLFRAMGDLKAEEVFKGMSLTVLWLNEADTLDRSVLKFGLPRVGRYHGSVHGWNGVIADFNAPDIDNWTYDFLVNGNIGLDADQVDEMRKLYGGNFGIKFHRQPGGLEPEAENLKNLRAGYYQQMMIGMSENDIRRFIHNLFGAVRNGQPVYPEYNDGFHCHPDILQPLPGIPLTGGLDGGATPAFVCGQEMPDGQLRLLGELVIFNPDANSALEKLGPRAFADEVRRFLAQYFPKCEMGTIWCDEATSWGGGSGAEDEAWQAEFARHGKFKTRNSPIPNKPITPRLEVVRGEFTTTISGKPSILISGPRCPQIRRGLNNGYVTRRIQYSNGSGRWKDEPDKNDFSHAQDALQCWVAGNRRRSRILANNDRRHAERRNNRNVKSTGFAAAIGGR